MYLTNLKDVIFPQLYLYSNIIGFLCLFAIASQTILKSGLAKLALRQFGKYSLSNFQVTKSLFWRL